MTEQTQKQIIPRSIRITGFDGAEVVFNPVGSQYKDPNEKSPTYGQLVTRQEASLVYTHGRQRLSFARTDFENMNKLVNSEKIKALLDQLPSTEVVDV